MFSDEPSGKIFADYQVKHHDQMLQPEDFRNLSNLWPHVPVCYLYFHGQREIYYPAQDPVRWWQLKSSPPRAK